MISKGKLVIPDSSYLLPLNPFLDSSGLLHVGGREQNSKLSYSIRHPIILCTWKEPLDKVDHLIRAFALATCRPYSWHCADFTLSLVPKSFSRLLVDVRSADVIPSNHNLKWWANYPRNVWQRTSCLTKLVLIMLHIKYSYVWKPTIIKAYICVLVSLSVKVVHLELVSDITADAFIAQKCTCRRCQWWFSKKTV